MRPPSDEPQSKYGLANEDEVSHSQARQNHPQAVPFSEGLPIHCVTQDALQPVSAKKHAYLHVADQRFDRCLPIH
jgi:hypothetical protein